MEELQRDEVETLENCLRSFDLGVLLGTLYEFIETYVKPCPPENRDWT